METKQFISILKFKKNFFCPLNELHLVSNILQVVYRRKCNRHCHTNYYNTNTLQILHAALMVEEFKGMPHVATFSVTIIKITTLNTTHKRCKETSLSLDENTIEGPVT